MPSDTELAATVVDKNIAMLFARVLKEAHGETTKSIVRYRVMDMSNPKRPETVYVAG